MMKLALALLLSLLLFQAKPLWAAEVTDYDSILVVQANCYGGALESGDILCIAHFRITYDTLPAETVTDAFLLQFNDTSGVPLRSASPYLYVTSGYNDNAASIYFSASDVADLGITYGDSSHSISLSGNPAAFASPPSVMTAVNWVVNDTDTAGDRVGDFVISLSNTFEATTAWSGTDLFSCDSPSGCILQSAGQDFWTNAVPNLRVISPGIFGTFVENPFTPAESEFSYTYQTDLQDAWTGTELEYTFDEVVAWIPAPVSMVKGVFVLILSLVVWGACAAALKDVPNGGIIAMLTVPIIIGVATYQGLVPYALVAGFGFIFLIIIGLWLVKR